MDSAGQTAKRPWGVPKTKPLCKQCGQDLVGDRLNVIEGSSCLDESGLTWGCTNCNTELNFLQYEKVVTYWNNGGMRQKPGRKPKQLDQQAS